MKRLIATILLGLLLMLAIMPGYALATEYLQPSENGTIWAQVRYLNGTPANGATVTMTLWASSGVRILNEVDMGYITGSRGIYHYNFTAPATTGVYAVDIITSNPTGYGSNEVHVSSINASITGNVTVNITAADIWNEPMVGYTDTDTFGGVINDFLGGGSMLLVGMILLCFGLMLFAFWRRNIAILWVAALAWLGFTFWQRSITPGWGIFDIHEILFYVGFLMSIICIVEAVMLLRGDKEVERAILAEARAGKGVTTDENAKRYQDMRRKVQDKLDKYRTPKRR